MDWDKTCFPSWGKDSHLQYNLMRWRTTPSFFLEMRRPMQPIDAVYWDIFRHIHFDKERL